MSSSTEKGIINLDDVHNVAEKSFLKMKLIMEKDGYREGIEEGKSKVFQEYFDEGYKDGFKNGFSLGQVKGVISAKKILDQSNSGDLKELENASTGACVICEDKNSVTSPISKIKLHQGRVLQTVKGETENKI